MEDDEISDVVPCSSLAVDSVLRVGTAGSIWGLCAAPHEARKNGLTGFRQASFVAKSIGKFGCQCGLVAGVFTSSRCVIQRYRRKNDWVSVYHLSIYMLINALLAGAVAGAAIAARTKNLTRVAGMVAVVSAFSTAADFYKRS